jgi:biotin synthase-like enzyme
MAIAAALRAVRKGIAVETGLTVGSLAAEIGHRVETAGVRAVRVSSSLDSE